MATRSKGHTTNDTFEQMRLECQWHEIANTLKDEKRIDSHDSYYKLLGSESQLELFLIQHQHDYESQAQSKLAKVKTDLEGLSRASSKVATEAGLLLPKLYYATGDIDKALQSADLKHVESILSKQPSQRVIKMVAETYAIRGLCLEKKKSDDTSELIRCLNRAGDLFLIHAQFSGTKPAGKAAKGAVNQPSVKQGETGPILEMAMQRSAIIPIKLGNTQQGIDRLREMLRAVDSPLSSRIKQTLSRQLSEILLRGICPASYKPPSLRPTQKKEKSAKLPAVPSKYEGKDLKVPHDDDEEALLLLNISKKLALKEVVLNRTVAFAELRQSTFHSAAAVDDLLAIALVRRCQFATLFEQMEKSLEYSFEQFHTWHQFALTALAAGKYQRAFLALGECCRLQPDNIMVHLEIAKMCFERMHNIEEGVDHCKKAKELYLAQPSEREKRSPLAARIYVLLGLGHSLLADDCRILSNRKELRQSAIEAYALAVDLQPGDAGIHYLIALELALVHRIPDALKSAERTLSAQPEHSAALHLTALLLAARGQTGNALSLARLAAQYSPNDLTLLLTISDLLEIQGDVAGALKVCQQALSLWRQLHEANTESDPRGTGLLQRVATDGRSLSELHLGDLAGKVTDSCSMRAESVAASRIEQALSDVASSAFSSLSSIRHTANRAWLLQLGLWLHLGNLYVRHGRDDEAIACVSEASSIVSLSHQVSWLRGRVHVAQNQPSEAKVCFENALSINPSHVPSMQELASLHLMSGSLRQAERLLREAVTVDSSDAGSWALLGETLQESGAAEEASDCLIMAMQLQEHQVVGTSFSKLPKLAIIGNCY